MTLLMLLAALTVPQSAVQKGFKFWEWAPVADLDGGVMYVRAGHAGEEGRLAWARMEHERPQHDRETRFRSAIYRMIVRCSDRRVKVVGFSLFSEPNTFGERVMTGPPELQWEDATDTTTLPGVTAEFVCSGRAGPGFSYAPGYGEAGEGF